jgi:hypothetical protein
VPHSLSSAPEKKKAIGPPPPRLEPVVAEESVPSDGQSRQDVVPAGIHAAGPTPNDVLMKCLLAKLERLHQSWKRAQGVGRADSVEKFSKQIEAVEKEIEDLESTLLTQARDAVVAED